MERKGGKEGKKKEKGKKRRKELTGKDLIITRNGNHRCGPWGRITFIIEFVEKVHFTFLWMSRIRPINLLLSTYMYSIFDPECPMCSNHTLSSSTARSALVWASGPVST